MKMKFEILTAGLKGKWLVGRLPGVKD